MHLLHVADVNAIGGIESNLFHLIRRTHDEGAHRHSLVSGSRAIHPHYTELVERHVDHFVTFKHAGPFKIPRRPSSLRRSHAIRLLQDIRPDIGVFWHWFGDDRRARPLRNLDIPLLYWERGLSWGHGAGEQTHAFLDSLSSVMVISHACERMLRLRWRYQGPIRLVRNAITPSCTASECAKQRDPNRPFELGTVARLESFKGVNLAIHAIAHLVQRGRAVHLSVAGTGPEQVPLQRLARRLGVDKHISFLGPIGDMPAFYRRIDCLLHPALREPFGTVLAEAQVYGCPVIVTAVDGTPEAVADGRSGLCLIPDRELGEFAALDGDRRRVHDQVYDPRTDALRSPLFVDPARFADNVERLMDDTDLFAGMSREAIRHARETFSAERLLDDFEAALTSVRR